MKKKNTWYPSVNEIVRVCYDGKHGRCEEGKITKVVGNSIRVKFKEWASDDDSILTAWFSRTNSQSYGSIVRVQSSLMDMMFGIGGDWYSVYPCIAESKGNE
jgi:hypothetical protein